MVSQLRARPFCVALVVLHHGCVKSARGLRRAGTPTDFSVRWPRLRKDGGRVVSDHVRDRWPCSAAVSPTDRSISVCLGASFTLCVHTGLQLSGCSRELCFRRLWHSTMDGMTQRVCQEPRRCRMIRDAILFRHHVISLRCTVKKMCALLVPCTANICSFARAREYTVLVALRSCRWYRGLRVSGVVSKHHNSPYP